MKSQTKWIIGIIIAIILILMFSGTINLGNLFSTTNPSVPTGFGGGGGG